MKQGNVKVFARDKQKLYQAVNMRINGISLTSIAMFFNCDRGSIKHQLDKYEIEPKTDSIYTVERIIIKSLPKPDESRWIFKNGEKINTGRMYKDYFNNIHIEKKQESSKITQK
jgi:hypothetical protein